MNIYAVNLDRSPERYEEFKAINAPVLAAVVRQSAVDGSTLDTEKLVEHGLVDRAVLRTYTPGALGYALTHLGLWHHAAERGEDITLCDDDAIFNRYFIEASATAVARLQDGWDLILWGWNFDSHLTFELLPNVSFCWSVFDQNAMRQGVSQFIEQEIDLRFFRLLRAFGTPCYSVSPNGARLLQQHCFPLRPMPIYSPILKQIVPNNGIDIMMNQLYSQMRAFVSFPPLVITKNDHRISTVQTGASLADLRRARGTVRR